MKIVPFNRTLLVKLENLTKKQSEHFGFIIPEDPVTAKKSRFVPVRVVEQSDDCERKWKDKLLLVERAFLQRIDVSDEELHMISENNVRARIL